MSTPVLTPIDTYLARQQEASAVERFAARHDADLLPPGQRWYSDRLPAEGPRPGQQYAFRVDLDNCTGCKACVAGCHSLNGLDEGESWRFAGQLVGTEPEKARLQTVPSGCHHCVDPACLAGCPTNAYEKDPVTGIVRHLDDQCIGCSYCTLTCPYEVPSFNKRLGIVRKCDMCADRLSEGEAPACVQACPTGAIAITVVDTQQVRATTAAGSLVPHAPVSSITTPTTQYVTARPLDDSVVGADQHALHLSEAHPPLAFMLVVTQLSVGAFLAAAAAEPVFGTPLPAAGAIAAAAAGLLAMAASVLHLGRPAYFWRAVLGLGHSWLSREIVVFGLYAALATAYGAATALDVGPATAHHALGLAGASAGLAGVGCSVAIYAVTHRAWWHARFTAPKFLLSATATGPLLLVAALLLTAHDRRGILDAVAPLASVAAVSGAAKLSIEAWFLRRAHTEPTSDLGRTATLLRHTLAGKTLVRFLLGTIGAVVLPIVLAAVAGGPDASAGGVGALAVVALLLALGGEVIERWQFFVACATPRMPGRYRS